MTSLNNYHQDQVTQFMQFYKGKRQLAAETIESDFSDTISDRVIEDLLAKADVEEIIESLCDVVKSHVHEELNRTTNMNALLLSQLFKQAEVQDLVLECDFSGIEDRAALEKVEKMVFDTPIKQAMNANAKLVSLKDEQAQMVKDMHNLRDDNEDLIAQNEKMKKKLQAALNENAGLQGQIESDRGQFEHESKEAAAQSKSKRGNLEAMEKELAQAKESAHKFESDAKEHDKAVSQTRQFQMMKKMLATKNSQLIDLRKRLQKYEPEDVDAADDE